jgi:hypothetical protein
LKLDVPEGSKDELEGELQAEANKEVTTYYARWSPRSHDGYIGLYFVGGTKFFTITNPEEFQVMVDLLRNEKPVCFVDSSDWIRTCSTEPVGEGE